jgi:hypothetical protein
MSTIYSSLLHKLMSSVYYTLHWSLPGNRFITVSLSFQITHEIFAQPNSFLAIILQLPTPETPSILCCNCQLRNSTDFNDLLCPVYNSSALTAQKTQPFYCCVNSSPRKRASPIAPLQRLYASCIVTPPLLLRTGITWQRLFLWLHSSCFEQIRHIKNVMPFEATPIEYFQFLIPINNMSDA